jgi:hypothetical protein
MPLTYSTTCLPDIRGQSYDRATPLYVTLQSDSTSAGDQRRNIAPIRYEYALGWQYLDDDSASLVYEAVLMLGGPWQSMYFFEWDETTVSPLIGVGDDVVATFTIPGKETHDQTFLVDGTPTAGTVHVGAGTNGEDTVEFGSPPTGGVDIDATFTGRVRQTVKIDSTTFGLADSPTGLWRAQLELVSESPVY